MGICLKCSSVRALSLETKVIYENHKLTIPWNWTGNNDVRKVPFTWDPTKTTINSVKLHCRAFLDQGTVHLDVLLNDHKAIAFAWGPLETNMWREQTVDVTLWLYNGNNYTKADLVKDIYMPTEDNCYLWLDLIIDYTGTPPAVPPPTPPTPPGLDWWWPWAIAGGAIALISVTGVVMYSEMKSREQMMLLMARR